MNRRVISGVNIAVDSFEDDGTPLNDSPLEDCRTLRGEEDDREHLCADQMTSVVTLEFLERRDCLDRMRYAILRVIYIAGFAATTFLWGVVVFFEDCIKE